MSNTITLDLACTHYVGALKASIGEAKATVAADTTFGLLCLSTFGLTSAGTEAKIIAAAYKTAGETMAEAVGGFCYGSASSVAYLSLSGQVLGLPVESDRDVSLSNRETFSLVKTTAEAVGVPTVRKIIGKATTPAEAVKGLTAARNVKREAVRAEAKAKREAEAVAAETAADEAVGTMIDTAAEAMGLTTEAEAVTIHVVDRVADLLREVVSLVGSGAPITTEAADLLAVVIGLLPATQAA